MCICVLALQARQDWEGREEVGARYAFVIALALIRLSSATCQFSRLPRAHSRTHTHTNMYTYTRAQPPRLRHYPAEAPSTRSTRRGAGADSEGPGGKLRCVVVHVFSLGLVDAEEQQEYSAMWDVEHVCGVNLSMGNLLYRFLPGVT